MYRLRQWFKDLFLYPRTTLGSDSDYWSARNRGPSASLSAWQKERADWVLTRLTETPVHMLDIGSGDGGVLKYLASKHKGLTGVGIDRDAGARASLTALGFEALDLDLTKDTELPACDYALLFEIIEHVPDAEGLLDAARRSARRGVFFSVPNTGFFTHRFRLLFGKFPAQWAVRPNEHVRFWTLADMRWWLKAQGIAHADVHPYEGVPYLRHVFPGLFAAGIMVWIPHV